MNGIVAMFIRRRKWEAACFSFCCAIAICFSTMGMGEALSVFLGTLLAMLWTAMLADTEQGGVVRVYRALPISREMLSLAVWAQRVVLPGALLVLIVALHTVGAALYGKAGAYIPCTATLVLWTGLSLSLFSGLFLSEAPRSVRRALKIGAVAAVALFFACQSEERLEHALSALGLHPPVPQTLLAASVILCVLCLGASFLLRKQYAMGSGTNLSAGQGAEDHTADVPQFSKRRRGLHWHVVKPMLGEYAILAVVGLVCGVILARTRGGSGVAMAGAMVFGVREANTHTWVIMRMLVTLPVRKREIIVTALALSLSIVYIPVLVGAGILCLWTVMTGQPVPPELTHFFAVQPLFLSIVFLFVGASPGTDSLRSGEMLSAALGVALVVLAMFALVEAPEIYFGLGDRTVLFLLGLLTLPLSLVLVVRLLERSLDDSAFYKKAPTP